MSLPPHPVASAPLTPVKRSTRPENGQQVEIFDLRQRFQIATPTRGTVTEVYLRSFARACSVPLTRYRQPDGSVESLPIVAGALSCVGDSHVDRARNVVANQFVENNQTDWLLWIDDDIEFGPQHIARLFVHAMNGHKFVCGHYAMKCLKPTFVANVAPGQIGPDKETGLIEITDAGTGFLLVHRDVFLALRDHPRVVPYQCAPNTPFPGAKHYPYFQSGTYGPKDPTTGLQNWLSEDWMLCRMWQELGGKVYGDTEIKLRHFGTLLYPPMVDDIQGALESLLRQNHPAVNRESLKLALEVGGQKSEVRQAA